MAPPLSVYGHPRALGNGREGKFGLWRKIMAMALHYGDL